MSLDKQTVQFYMAGGFSMLIAGHAGTGKTTVVKQAVEALGWRMKYYSTPTLDPFTDLVGIPVPQVEEEVVKYFRPRAIDQAEVIFFDELNRGDTRTLNAVFEIIQFGTLNGEPLPHLKCVVAAINPNDGDYTVDELDPALLDRFDFYLQADPAIDVPYFTEVFGNVHVATAVKTWWETYHRTYLTSLKSSMNPSVYISPRRMEKVVKAYLAFPSERTLIHALPPGAPAPVQSLAKSLDQAVTRGRMDKERQGRGMSQEREVPNAMLLTMVKDQVQAFKRMTPETLRRGKGEELALHLYTVPVLQEAGGDRKEILRVVAQAANQDAGGPTIVSRWGELIVHMEEEHLRVLSEGWSKDRRESVAQAMLHRFGKRMDFATLG